MHTLGPKLCLCAALVLTACASEVSDVGSSTEALVCAAGTFNHAYSSSDPAFTVEWDGLASHTMARTAHGSVVSVHTVVSNGQRDVVLTRVNQAGELVWSRRYGHPNRNEEGRSVVLSHHEDHVLFTGESNGSVLVAQIALSDGSVTWSRTYGAPSPILEEGRVIARSTGDSAAQYVVLARAIVGNRTHIYVLRIDDGGNLVWAYRFFAPDHTDDEPVDLEMDGNVAWVASQHEETDGTRRFALLSVRSNGGRGSAWVYTHGADSAGNGGASTSLGNVALLGQDGFVATFGLETQLGQHLAVLQIDTEGAPLLERTYAPSNGGPAMGLSIEPSSTGFDVATAIGDVGDARLGLLRLGTDTFPLSHHTYRDIDSIAAGTAMEVGAGGIYMLRSQEGPQTTITTVTSTGDGCCQELDPMGTFARDALMQEREYGSILAGTAVNAVLPAVAFPVEIASCPESAP